MINNCEIDNFFSNKDMSTRKKGNNPRFIDQKCTPDVISFIADCIINLDKETFDRNDLWKSSYFAKNATLIFGKPSPKNENVANEYDKFISQPLDLLAYAELIEKEKIGIKNHYRVINYEMLEFIALKDMNALVFLHSYLSKILKDSGFYKYIENFLKAQDKDSFIMLKEKFIKFLVATYNLGVRGSSNGGEVEARRIFSKVVNVFSFFNSSKGSIKGNLSKRIILYTDLVYNRTNFRDIDKLKNVARKEKKGTPFKTAYKYNEFLINKAKQWIKKHHPLSEIKDNLYANGKTDSVHHIFPKSDFPEISAYIENLIALTSGQHLTNAHPNGKTNKISVPYQMLCLKTKSKDIEKDIKNGVIGYSKHNFIFVLNTGFQNKISGIPLKATFKEINNYIDLYYKIS